MGPLLAALRPLDLTQYPVVAVLDLKLPLAPGGLSPELLVPAIQRFMDCGGSVLQINCVDPAVLLEAREHPERHTDLVVRVSGYGAYFTGLSTDIQDEVIPRTVVVG